MKDRSEKQSKNKTVMSRREMLGAMASAGVFLLLPSAALSQTLTSDVQRAKGGKEPFSVTTRTKDGISIFATAEPNRIAFDIQGPIKPGKGIPLLVRREVDGQFMEDPKQAMEAVKQLLAASESFAEPHYVEILKRRTKAEVEVRFMFLGEENPDRRINLTVTLKDDRNRVINRTNIMCSDGRISIKNEEKVFLGREAIGSPVNRERMKFDLALRESIRGIEIVFERI